MFLTLKRGSALCTCARRRQSRYQPGMNVWRYTSHYFASGFRPPPGDDPSHPPHRYDPCYPRPAGSLRSFACAPGFQLDGSKDSVCGQDNKWSHATPTCYGTVTCKVRLCHKKTPHERAQWLPDAANALRAIPHTHKHTQNIHTTLPNRNEKGTRVC